MGCSGCGNPNCSGCSSGCGCASNVTSNQVVLTPVECGVRPCSPLANCTNIPPASPSPYYECTPQCQEDHCQQVNVFNYVVAICVTYAFNMPACGQTANIYFTDLKVLPVGVYLWHATYGYLKVVAFNLQTGLVTVLNECQTDNAAVGTSIPACTCFIVTPAPIDLTNPTFFPFVAVDFTAPPVAPAVGSCITITVTTVAGLSAGDVVAIGAGFYTIDSIVSPTSIVICNNGSGVTPGTPIIAKNAAGEFQYPIIVTSNCCSQISSEAFTDDGFPPVTQNPLTTLSTNNVSFVINNPSTSRTMHVLMNYTIALEADTASASIQLRIDHSLNGAPFANIESLIDTPPTATTKYGRQLCASERYIIAPSTSLVLLARGQAERLSGGAVDVESFYIRGRGIAVAL